MTRARRVWSVIGGFVALGIVISLAILVWPASPPPKLAIAKPTPALIARGAYLATAADCIACHTQEKDAPYAGGRAFKLPFGTIYSSNITADRETGIGAWTDGEFLRAVHKGVGRQGEELYPAFPYTSYTRLDDADVLAIKAYLFSLPPVHHQVEKNALRFPFNQRPLMRFWKILFMPRHPFQNTPTQSMQWNRGAYLVTALGHCGECHTPRNVMYGLSGKALAGETMQGWTAWNITSDADHGVGAWSVEDLDGYLRSGYAPDRAVASGPMKEAIDYSLTRLTPEDTRAIAVYLKSTPAVATGPTVNLRSPSMLASTFMAPASTEDNRDPLGKQVFEEACSSCHAWNGQGQQTPIAALRGRRSVYDPTGVNTIQTVLRGGAVDAPQGHAFMPAFARGYSNAEIAAVTNYVLAHFGAQTSHVLPKDVAKARQN